IQIEPPPPSLPVIANSIHATLPSVTFELEPHARSSRERRTVIVCHAGGHAKSRCLHHQTLRPLGSTSLNSKLLRRPSPRRSNVNAKFFGSESETAFRTMT